MPLGCSPVKGGVGHTPGLWEVGGQDATGDSGPPTVFLPPGKDVALLVIRLGAVTQGDPLQRSEWVPSCELGVQVPQAGRQAGSHGGRSMYFLQHGIKLAVRELTE